MGTFTMPQSTDVSNFVDKPCQAHVVIQSADENPKGKNGDMLAWGEVGVTLSVLAATDESQVRRQHSQVFAKPDMSSRDGGEFQSKILARLAMAAGIIPPAMPGQQVTVNWQDLAGKQLIVFFNEREDRDDASKKYIQIHGAHLYHINDPDAKHVPKDQEALKLAPQSASASTPTPTQSAPQQTQQTQHPVAAAASSAPSWDDL